MIPARLLQLAFFAAIAFTVVMALLPKPPEFTAIHVGDKVQHMMAFAALALIARIAFSKASSWAILERLSFFGALIEVFQSLPALHRDCDPRDWIADTAAAAAVLLVCAAVRRLRQTAA